MEDVVVRLEQAAKKLAEKQIKRLLRKPQYRDAVQKYVRTGDGTGCGLDVVAQRIFDQARSLYRYRPDVETDRLFT